MKKRWIGYGVSLLVLSALVIPAWAGDTIRNEDARLRPDYSIVIDGREMHFQRADGSPAFALVYEDSTYLPLRAIGEALGKNVNWDESSKTITIGGTRTTTAGGGTAATGKSETVTVQVRPDFTIVIDGKECQFQTSAGKNIYPLLYQGSTYLPLRAIGQIMEKEITWNQASKTVTMTSNGLTVTDADSFVQSGNTTSTTTTTTTTTDIGVEKAKQLAFSHAGLSASKVQWLDMDTDWDDGKKEYEIEFCDGTIGYEYVVDAATGTICKSATDMYMHHNHQHNATHHNTYSYGHNGHHNGYYSGYDSNGNTTQTTDIGAEKAKQLALNHAGLTAAEVRGLRAEADWENGRRVYEVEFRNGGMEYEYELDAASGAILKAEREYED